MKKVLVLKLGTAAITTAEGLVNTPLLRDICAQVAMLHQKHHILMVSSGAVGSGKPLLERYKGTLNQKKAAAAVGNPLLMAQYAKHFSKHSITVAQCLLERQHFNNRKSFVQLNATIHELWKSNIIPIANDNDVVNDRELRFTDNDELATLLAVAFNAGKLLIGSSVDGLLDRHGAMLHRVPEVDENVFSMVRPEKSAQGLGGMFSKLTHTRLATHMGIETVIFNAKLKGNVLRAYGGEVGTTFAAHRTSLNARQKWLMSGAAHDGVVIDDGAVKALRERKSLLGVGVAQIKGAFVKGEMIEIEDLQGNVLAMAKSRVSAADIHQHAGKLVVAHANDIVLT